MRRTLATVVILGASMIGLSGIASADAGDYENNPGRQQATVVGAQCGSGAGSGAFGYFGKDNNLGVKSDPTDPGANGQQTGLNNSSVCGNRQGNLP